MKLPFGLLLLSLMPFAVFAADDKPQRNPYPDDYKASACAPNEACESYPASEMTSAGSAFLGLSMNPQWVQDHYDELRAAIKPLCAKLSTCYATPGNGAMFCNDLTAPMMRSVCDDKFPNAKDPVEHERCRQFIEVYALGIDQHAKPKVADAQKCAGPAAAHTKPPIVWMSPEKLRPGYDGYVTFYAIDPDTHVPVAARITFENQIHYAPSNPSGESATYYPFKLPFKHVESTRADGHRDLLTPMVTVAADNYPPVQFRLNAAMPEVVVTMNPPIAKLKRGAMATITAKDAATGEPVELRVFVGNNQAGDTNQPIAIDWAKNEKRPEIWARSLFNRYSDVVIAPAAK